MADVQDNLEEELKWDLLAMDAAMSLTDERLKEGGVDFKVEGFLPSLHLNLADNYLRLDESGAARKHVTLGRSFLVFLGHDGYREMIEIAFNRIDAELEASIVSHDSSQDLN